MNHSYGDDPQSLIDLIAKVRQYNPRAEVQRVRDAYYYAERWHSAGPKREDGSPYISHPLAVAHLLADLRMDVDSLAAGLLHDVMEDCGVPPSDLVSLFGEQVYQLVEGCTKLSSRNRQLEGESDYARRRHEIHRAAENLRKVLLAMGKDIRVMVIKLADRLHNMLTLDALDDTRQRRIALETRQIYAPLAARLGMWQMKWNLEDLAFKYLNREQYLEMSALVAATRSEREASVEQCIVKIKERLEKDGVEAEVQGRPKHLWSIYQKMVRQGLSFDDVYDLIGLRIIVNTERDCYHVLGLVHELWPPIPSLFFDYIARPKANKYSSLHTKVMGPRNEPVEVQIRTWKMHKTAELGIAAHWQYKEGGRLDEAYASELLSLREQLVTWASDETSSSDFLTTVVNDVFADQVLVFTPKNDVIDLPVGATPIDLAYRIHTDLGHRTIGAKVNGRIVPLSYALANGDTVEILSRSNTAPSADWLNFAKTAHARAKIRAYLRKANRGPNSTLGRTLIERELKYLGLNVKEFVGEAKLERLAVDLARDGVDDLLAAVGEGLISVRNVVTRLRGLDTQPQAVFDPFSVVRQSRSPLQVSADGLEAMMMRRAECCGPVPGDEVIGYVTRGKGIVIHRQACPNALNMITNEPERVTPIQWSASTNASYDVPLRIHSSDKQGLVMDVAGILAESKGDLTSFNARKLPDDTALIDCTVAAHDLEHLRAMVVRIESLPTVREVERVIR